MQSRKESVNSTLNFDLRDHLKSFSVQKLNMAAIDDIVLSALGPQLLNLAL